MNKKISLFILMILTLSLFGSSPAPVNAVTWWDNDWSYKMKITINATKVDADLTDFPVLVYLNSSRIDWTHVQDDLNDLRFINSTETIQLYAELENYTINDEAWIWVKIPTVGDTVDTDFYLYYGNNAVSSWWNPEDMWEDSAVMVQHMTDNPDNAHVMDSTQYDNDGEKKAANEPIETTLGKINSAQIFDGEDDYIQAADSPSLDVNQITVSAWIKPSTVASGERNIVSKDYYTGWEFSQIGDGLKVNCRIGGVYYSNYLPVSGVLYANTWAHVAFTFDGSVGTIYVDGAPVATRSDVPGVLGVNSVPLFIGSRGGSALFFGGLIDEARVYNAGKFAERVLADYYSGSDNLLIYGAESIVPLALTVCYNTGINKLYINGTQRANNTTIYIDKNNNVNATVTLKSNFIFMKYMLGLTEASLTPIYVFNMTNPFTLWSYATPNFFIYEEPTTFTFTHWLILLFVALVISLLAAIKFHIIATVSLILVLYMVINVASYTGIILLAIIVWLLTIMFSIMAFAEI